MKRGYYLYADNLIGNSLNNKIRMQIKAFNETSSVTDCVLQTVNEHLLKRLLNVFPLCSYGRNYNKAIQYILNPDFLYIRMIYVDREYISFLVRIKDKYPSCKIILEIPTYPYKREWCASAYGKAMYLKDVIFRREYKRYVDRIVTYSYDDVINGVKTIQTMNGLDVDSFSPVSDSHEYDPKCIKLIAVAYLMRHHGYERVIEGLKNYYKVQRDRKVYISIIGDGAEKKKYERLIKKYKLSEYIGLIGPKYGEDLEKEYDKADAGLAGFGFYKDGVCQVGTLKTREYLAKGLPVILGAKDRLFDTYGYEYGLLFPGDDSPVNFELVLDFLDGVYLNRPKRDVVCAIRKFARETIDNRVTLRPIIEYIENNT